LGVNNIYTNKRLISTICLPTFDFSAHNLHTITAKNITNQTICIQFNLNTTSHVGSTQSAQFAHYCTLLLVFLNVA